MIKIKVVCAFLLTTALLVFLKGDTIFASSKEIAFVLKVKGKAEVMPAKQDWKPLRRGRRLNSGDKVRTGNESLVAVVFTDDRSMMKIRSESEVSFYGERKKRGIAKRISMNIGQMWAKVNPRGAGFRLETPSGVAAVKGTEFYGFIDEFGQTTIIGIEGLVELFNQLGSVLVGQGQTGILKKNAKPGVEKTKSFEDWAKLDDSESQLEIEFENEEGVKKRMKIRFKEK